MICLSFVGRYLEPWYHSHRAGQRGAAKFRPTSDEGAIFNSEKRPASTGRKLQQVIPRICRKMFEQRTCKRKDTL